MSTGQRKLASVTGVEGFAALLDLLRAEVGKFQQHLGGLGFKMVLKEPVVLGNDPEGPDRPVKAQARHTDMQAGRYGVVAVERWHLSRCWCCR